MTASRIIALNVARPAELRGHGEAGDAKVVQSAIVKTPVNDRLYLSRVNFKGDGQADLENHGGPDKAVCVYSHQHYPYWERQLGRALPTGAFGENVTVVGMVEQDVCIGDVYRLGDALVQVSQPRQPCYKLAWRHGEQRMAELVVATGYTGYYFRVLEEGDVAPDAAIELAQAHPLGVTVAEANRVKYRDKQDRDALERLLSVDALSDAWRKSLEARLSSL